MTTITILTGEEISGAIDALADLRLTIFREYPYLYDGRLEDERTYLRSYTAAPDACVILAHDGQEVVGAATGMPLLHEDPQLLNAFAATTFPLDKIYYVGELLLRPDYRNHGLGQRLLRELEDHLRPRGTYRMLTCATVERPGDHPRRPPNFIPITRFLARTGFTQLPGVTTSFAWRESDGVKREHAMHFWLKDLGERKPLSPEENG